MEGNIYGGPRNYIIIVGGSPQATGDPASLRLLAGDEKNLCVYPVWAQARHHTHTRLSAHHNA